MIWKAYQDAKNDIWDQNFIDGKYIISFEINPYLDRKLQSMLPLVRFNVYLFFHVSGFLYNFYYFFFVKRLWKFLEIQKIYRA